MGIKKGKMHPSITAAIIGAVVVILVASGAFTSADIHPAKPLYGTVCPSYFGSNDFGITFSNTGNRGTDLYVKLSSPDNISFPKGNDLANIPTGQPTPQSVPFQFLINLSSMHRNQYGSIDNATIIIDVTYQKYFWSPTKTTTSCICVYKEGGFLEKDC